MKFRHAKKLHNEDEVIDKKTGLSMRVLFITVIEGETLKWDCYKRFKSPFVLIETCDNTNGISRSYFHTEIQ